METPSDANTNQSLAANAGEAVKAAAAEQIAPKRTRRWRARLFQAYLLLATIAFAVLAALASLFNYFPVDLSLTRALQTIHAAWFASLMLDISAIGYSPQFPILIVVVAILLFALGVRWEALVTLGAGLGSGGLDTLIKLVVHRPRPGANLVNVLQMLSSYSFPSGHVLTYTAFFGFLIFLSYTLLKPSVARTALLVMLGGLVAFIGPSRMYVGDHWASDVAGAYLLGSLFLAFSVSVYRWGKTRFFVQQPLAPERPAPHAPQTS